ncbi:PKD domain-containing protein [Halobellus ruber]|uniref:Right-handed parallel beta-helix repeat-containing protein n=1 Tax=Halobellus ruber TaxID=2761102 RepID=A0A7J9SMZ6_9EURY|nr:right-handed parallel beta-helix repeat-containing protein [Halobellus ruber]MBB6647437.1 right-handed parallel beta-helix repeat-containing protein [Halobellus ruber]
MSFRSRTAAVATALIIVTATVPVQAAVGSPTGAHGPSPTAPPVPTAGGAAAQTEESRIITATGPEEAAPGDRVSVSFNLTNPRNASREFVVDVVLPSGWRVVNQSGDGGTWNATRTAWRWQRLDANESVAPSVTVSVPGNETGGDATVRGIALSRPDFRREASHTVTVVGTPEADAGRDRTVTGGQRVELNATGSSNPDNDRLSFSWTQTGGPDVPLRNNDTATPEFTAPTVNSSRTLVFEVTASDGNASDTDTVNVTVRPGNTPPIADAGPDRTATGGTAVELNASGSSDPDGDRLSFLWAQTSGPTVTLRGSTTATPTFTTPEVKSERTLVFEVTVSDGTGFDSDTVNVTVQPGNTPPTADAGRDRTTVGGRSVRLNASGSSDPDGDALSFSWTQTAGPNVTLQGATTATPGFTAPDTDTPVTLAFELTVADGNGGSDTDTVSVTVRPANQPPTADAGPDRTTVGGRSVRLNASGSSDPDGDALSFSWTQTAGPNVTLQGATTATPGFGAPSVSSERTLRFEVTVSDGDASDTDTVNVTIQPADQPPTAAAGSNRTVEEREPVALDGTGSSDPDADPLSFSWTQTAGPSVSFRNASTATPEFAAPTVDTATDLTFELVVSDGNSSDRDAVTVTVLPNEPPRADAGYDRRTLDGRTVALDGSASSDPDGDTLSFSWTQTSGPNVTLQDAGTATPEFAAPIINGERALTFELTVSDGDGGSDTDTVTITLVPSNYPPTADAGANRTVNRGTSVTLNATGSSDPDGDSLSYRWAQTAGPNVTLRNGSTATPEFTAPDVDTPTTLTFAVTVSDGNGEADTDTVTVTATGTIHTVTGCTRITRAGTYRLAGNVTANASRPCFFVSASDVVIDGNGHTVAAIGSGDDRGHPLAVRASPSVSDPPQGTLSNVTVRDIRFVNWTEPAEFTDVNDTTVENVTVENATRGSGFLPESAIRFDGGTTHRIVGTRVLNASDRGIGLFGASGVSVRRTTVDGSGGYGVYVDRGGNHTLGNTTVTDNFVGIGSFDGGLNDSVIVDNAINSNDEDGILLGSGAVRNVRVVDNTLRDNGGNGIEATVVYASAVAGNDVGSNGGFGVYADRIQDSRVVENAVSGNAGLGVLLVATSGTSRNNTVAGNDLRANRGGIKVSDSDASRVRNNTVRPGGGTGTGISVSGSDNATVRNNTVDGAGNAVYVTTASNVTVRDNTLTNSSTGIGLLRADRHRAVGNVIRNNRVGIRFIGDSQFATVRRNRIVNNTDGGIEFDSDSPVDTVTVRRNVIAGNGRYGIRNDADAVVDATRNWWGSPDGPSSPGSATRNLSDPSTGAVANGSGDAVSAGSNRLVANVRFDPWLTTSPAGAGAGFRVTTDRLARTKLGEPVTHRLTTRQGTSPVDFDVVNGSLPPGMTLHDDGVLNGTPTRVGNYTFTVRATDGDGTTANATLTKRVSATIPSADIVIDKEGGRAVAGRKQLYVIRVKNTGNTIARDVPVSEYLQPWFTYASSTPAPDNVTTQVTRNGSRERLESILSRNGTTVELNSSITKTTIKWSIDELRPGESQILTYQAQLDENLQQGFTVTGRACSCSGPCCEDYEECLEESVEKCEIPALLSEIGKTTPGIPVEKVCRFLADTTGCRRGYKSCRARNGLPGRVPECDKDRRRVQQPVDPNEKIVAADRYIQPDRTLPYAVRFENVGNAPARNVTVTDTLPTTLNRSSVEVLTANRTRKSLAPGESVTLLRQNRTRTKTVTIGNRTVTRNVTVVEHHTATLQGRTLRWRLENVDLAPNATGTLLFSADPASGLSTGTRIENNATIRFDQVSSLTTNDTVNIVDDAAPTCRMDSLPAESPRNVSLSWTVTDRVGEVETVSVFVSTDGETWTTAPIDTDGGNASFVGDLGEEYRFMCVAEDTAGNREAQTPSVEASTTVASADINGTILEADGDPAVNDTVTVGDTSGVGFSTAVVDPDGGVVCGLGRVNRVPTDAAGRFSLTTEADTTKGVSYYQAHTARFLRANATPPPGSVAFPRDGSPDIYALTRVNTSADRSIGPTTLPDAHTLNVTVVTEAGVPVEDALVAFGHTGTDGARAAVVFPNATNADGMVAPEATDAMGIEVVGNVSVVVRPPSGDSFTDRTYTRNLTVDSDRNVTVELETDAAGGGDGPGDTGGDGTGGGDAGGGTATDIPLIDVDPDVVEEAAVEQRTGEFDETETVSRITFDGSAPSAATVAEFDGLPESTVRTILERIVADVAGIDSPSEVGLVAIADVSPSSSIPDETSATVEIEVSSERLNDPESAVIVHRGADGWTLRETTVRDVGDGTVTLTAPVDSFSLVAVVERPSLRATATGQTPTPAPTTATATPEADGGSTPSGGTQAPEAVGTEPSTSLPTEPGGFDPGVAVALVLVAGIAVVVTILRRRNEL